MVLDDADGESGTAPVLSATADVPPGKTAQVQIGGAGRKVSGKFLAPPGVVIWSWTNQVTLAQAFTDGVSYNMPTGLTGNAAEEWKLEFADTEAGHAYFRDSCAYQFTVGDDGSFVLPEVLPGKYRLFVNVAHGTPGPGAKASDDPGSPIIAQGGAQFSVPETSADEAGPVNLGEIMLTPQP
jgi:hypothetical protein